MEDWQRAEQRFVDDPELVAREADSIVRGVLTERGHPDDDFDTQVKPRSPSTIPRSCRAIATGTR